MGKYPNFQVAGANTAAIVAASAVLPPLNPLAHGKLIQAYTEGRGQGRIPVSVSNPHPFNTPQFAQHFSGYSHGAASNGNFAGSVFWTGIPDRV